MFKNHTILMAVLCLFPMGAVAAILFFGLPVNQVFLGLLILLCPISHLVMMKYMVHNHDKGHGDNHGVHYTAKSKPNEPGSL